MRKFRKGHIRMSGYPMGNQDLNVRHDDFSYLESPVYRGDDSIVRPSIPMQTRS